jgi:hypothetical protein
LASWTDQLKPLAIDALKPLPVASLNFLDKDRAARKAGAATAEANVEVRVKNDLKYATRAVRRAFRSLEQVQMAARLLDRLPDDQEAYHIVLSGKFSMWHFVPSIAQIADPHIIDELHVVTLSYSGQNMTELLKMIDNVEIRSVTFTTSTYFAAMNRELYRKAVDALTANGHRIRALLVHAKMLLIRLADGRKFTLESSANLRSCNNIEQAVLTCDAGLYDFHRAWIEKLYEAEYVEPAAKAKK